MPYTVAGKNSMLNSFKGKSGTPKARFISLHSGVPTIGGNEISGGTPAYGRQPQNFKDAVNGEIESGSFQNFNVPAGSTINHIGFWSEFTNGVLVAWSVVPEEVFTTQGIYNLTSSKMDLNLEPTV